ncbi:hypothetical protein M440DRAFT_1436413 [Trichoderma longibrachiatum ATCC 18648]|uniref:Heterokaryon incompatibility domain-containing protein n=1 Tax=Trichoderma longibrachiatum ATCC 18648 TaxID=983965 RepID=A0A2T4CBW0_TRILO|nr:hypothetical protein M440DRAFT_1436413 [Trichoderma longibrachiatum ATCC 18648]
MTKLHHWENFARLAGTTAVPWPKGSLKDALSCHFCTQKILQADQTRLGKDFTAWDLNCIGNVDIRWTTNLADHLRFVDEDQAVFIFHCVSFLQVHKSFTEIDPQLVKCEPIERHKLRLGDFNHWHDRLVILKQVLDESTPSTLSQRWHDVRNCLRWYTFWIAIPLFAMTFLFWIVHSVEGAVQIYLTCKGFESGT